MLNGFGNYHTYGFNRPLRISWTELNAGHRGGASRCSLEPQKQLHRWGGAMDHGMDLPCSFRFSQALLSPLTDIPLRFRVWSTLQYSSSQIPKHWAIHQSIHCILPVEHVNDSLLITHSEDCVSVYHLPWYTVQYHLPRYELASIREISPKQESVLWIFWKDEESSNMPTQNFVRLKLYWSGSLHVAY